MPSFLRKRSPFTKLAFVVLIGSFLLLSSILFNNIKIHAASESQNKSVVKKLLTLSFQLDQPKTVKLILHGQKVKVYLSKALTIHQFLDENKLILDERDILSSNTYNTLTSETTIYIDQFDVINTITHQPIDFNTEYTYTQELPQDTEKIIRKGSLGIQEKIIQKNLKNGTVISEKILTEHEYKAPQTEKINLGTRKVYRTITINGDTFQYHKMLRVWGTSYDHNCLGCNNYTATGSYLDTGTIAVDPTVIPLYTKMYVPGYGFGQALDVGGAIKGNKIDLGFDDLSKHQGEWSARWVDIYLLD